MKRISNIILVLYGLSNKSSTFATSKKLIYINDNEKILSFISITAICSELF